MKEAVIKILKRIFDKNNLKLDGKQEVVKVLKKALKKQGIEFEDEKIEKLIEIPKDFSNGDYAFPCFVLNDQLKLPTHQIAIDIRRAIKEVPKKFQEIQTVGPYVNFFINHREQIYESLKEILKKREKFGKSNLGKRKTIVVEFSSPNIAKPFGIGHIRSTIIGNSIANICKFQGFTIKKINYHGYWGSQFGQLIFEYKKFRKEKT